MLLKRNVVLKLLTLLLLATFSVHLYSIEAVEKPKWELGIAGGSLYSPHYPASGERGARAIAAPFGIYRGDFLKVGDGNFVKGVLFDENDVEFDFSFNGAFNADSADNKAREGMPDLDYLIEFGPSMTLRLREDSRSRFELGVPLRVVVSTSLSNLNHRGYVFNPVLRYRRQNVFGSNTRIISSFGLTFATEKLQDYFYSVNDAYVTSERDAYDAKGGYLGANFSLGISYPVIDKLRFFWGTRVDFYQGAENANSPLFTDDTTLSFSFGFSWRLAQSDQMVPSKAIR